MDLHMFAGASFTLPCVSNNLFADTYQWIKDGVVLTSNTNLIITPGTGLGVLSAKRSHSGVYYCVVTNDAASVNVSARVDVTSSVITCDGQWMCVRMWVGGCLCVCVLVFTMMCRREDGCTWDLGKRCGG